MLGKFIFNSVRLWKAGDVAEENHFLGRRRLELTLNQRNCSAAVTSLTDKTTANQVQIAIKVNRKIFCGRKENYF